MRQRLNPVRPRWSQWLAAFFGMLLLLPSAGANTWRFDGVERIVAVSDVHGAYDAMQQTLNAAGLIDADNNWVGGETHLVITGDLLDRGADSRRVMDLVMNLEPQAEAAGGKVHQLIGNHEVMNLAGDLRYVAVGEYAAFAADETAEERQAWFERQQQPGDVASDPVAAKKKFDEQAPPGFFAHRRAFAADGQYGRWLLEKPLMVVINGTAFVHGGISPFAASYGLDGINGTLGGELRRYVEALGQVETAGLLSPLDSFYDHAKILQRIPPEQAMPPEVRAAVDTVIELNGSEIHGPDSPLWYRGSVGCSELIEGDRLDAALEKLRADRAVIGHTPTLTRRVLRRMSGRIIEIDTGMLNAAYRGVGNALIIENGALSVINQSGETYSPVEHPRRVGVRPQSLDAESLKSLLADGQAVLEQDGDRVTLNVSSDTATVGAWFDAKPRKKGFYPELAVYRLDQLLGLDMVPVTVRYEFDGKDGTLQFRPGSIYDEQRRATSGRGSSAWCPLQEQWMAMYIFDALLHNNGRQPANMLYSTDNWQLILSGHEDTFSNSSKRPAYIREVELKLSSYWIAALRALDEADLTDALGDVLDKRQIAAILKRRDALLKEAGE